MLLKKMQQYWMSILKDKKIFMGNYYICKIFAILFLQGADKIELRKKKKRKKP